MGELVRLEAEHRDGIYEFLADSPIENVMVMDRLQEEGLPGRPYQEFVAYRSAGEWLGLAYFSGDIALYAPDERAIAPLAEYALQRVPLVPRIISRRESVDAFWEIFKRAPYPVLFDRRQLVYELGPEDLCGDREPAMRVATVADTDAVARLASAMSFEEIQLDPLKDYPLGYRRLVEQRIELGRYYVLEEDGQIKFQVHLNSLTPFAGQITGVFTPPEFRRQGYAARGMAEFCHLALCDTPRLCLFVNDFNLAALSLYEGLGFKTSMEYRAVFMDGAP